MTENLFVTAGLRCSTEGVPSFFQSDELQDVIARTGTDMTAEDFVYSVSLAYTRVAREFNATDMAAVFRASQAYSVFLDALRQAKKIVPSEPSVLVIGCGQGFAGRSSVYAESVVREIFPSGELAKLNRWDLTPADLCDIETTCQRKQETEGKFDMLVTHSLPHFVPDVTCFFQIVDRLTVNGGIYVMAQEPNARFWRNPECRQSREDKIAEKRKHERWNWQRYCNPMRVARRIARALGLVKNVSLFDLINDDLRKTIGIADSLSEQEIRQIVDPHLRSMSHATVKIGDDGFDHDQLVADALSSFELNWLRTYNHLGFLDRGDFSERWKQIQTHLCNSYPQDGSSLSAVWWKRQR